MSQCNECKYCCSKEQGKTLQYYIVAGNNNQTHHSASLGRSAAGVAEGTHMHTLGLCEWPDLHDRGTTC